MLKKFFVLVFVFLILNPAYSYNGKIAFDLDETLIESDKLDHDALDLAVALGYIVKESNGGQDYIVRPGARELLDYAKSQGFSLIIMTHNRPEYAKDILESSGLFKYFDEVITMEDCKKAYNLDFSTYPYHRNKVHKVEASPLERYFSTFYKGFVLNWYKRLQGNTNIHPYLPCVNCDKYPPLYGARIIYDNSDYNIEDAVDYAGIKVKPFYAKELQKRVSEQGDYLWVDSIKKDLDYLKDHSWVEFYELKFHQEPIINEVKEIKD